MSRLVVLISGLLATFELLQISGILKRFGLYFSSVMHLAITLLGVLLIIFFERYDRGKKPLSTSFSTLLTLMSILGIGFILVFFDRVMGYSMYGYTDTLGIVFGLCLIIAVLEGTRKVIGWTMPILILFFLGATLFQEYLPGALNGPSTPLDSLMYNIYVGTTGVFGAPFNIAVNVLFPFIIFGALFQLSGGGQWFINLALSISGRFVGGPAKASVLASAMMGSITGSVGGNVASTGTFTIPLMKKIGYTPAFAAGVEATASTGSAILPPVMGAVAFIMAEFMGVSYSFIVMSALIPALLYYTTVFVSVHFRAKLRGLSALDKSSIPPMKETMSRGWVFFLPIIVLLVALFALKMEPQISALVSLPFIIAVSFVGRDRSLWLVPRRIWEAFIQGVQTWIPIAIVTASVGMLVGSLELSGLGHLFSRFIIDLGQGNLILTLLLVGIASLILGMGLDAVPAYLTLVVLTAPALVDLGLSQIQSHMYIMYWGLASFLTPPVCIAVFVAAGISGSKIWESAFEALRVGIAVFIVPLAFALDPSLLMQGDWTRIAFATVSALLGATLLAASIQGYLFARMNAAQRVTMGCGSILMLLPDVMFFIIGLLLAAIAIISGKFIKLQRLGDKKQLSIYNGD